MVTVDKLKKTYGDFRLDISMEIPEGRVSGIVGKNGAGKSTTIKAILGLIRPDSGTVTINGKDASKLRGEDKQHIGAALSESGFSLYLNAEDVCSILKKMYPSFDESFFRDNCTAQGLPLSRPIKEYSTGMKAKLRVLVALSHRAELLVMDEPTAGLDVEARNDILDMIRTYLSENESCSVVITSHISSDLEGICDDIYLIHDGKVLVHEDTDAILGKYAILKMDPESYEKLDKSYILKAKKDVYGYSCFTNERQFYSENYPGMVIEGAGIDDLILMMAGGEENGRTS